jgi:hypothetical protein
MEYEYETHCDIDGERGQVVVTYFLERGEYEPEIFGIFNAENDQDITVAVPQNEYERISEEVLQDSLDRLTASAEAYFEGDR